MPLSWSEQLEPVMPQHRMQTRQPDRHSPPQYPTRLRFALDANMDILAFEPSSTGRRCIRSGWYGQQLFTRSAQTTLRRQQRDTIMQPSTDTYTVLEAVAMERDFAHHRSHCREWHSPLQFCSHSILCSGCPYHGFLNSVSQPIQQHELHV
jgi:hypothetical protein